MTFSGKRLYAGWLLGMALCFPGATGWAQGPATFIFPQFANGSYEGGRIRSTLILQNASAAMVVARVEFFTSNGLAFSVPFTDGQSGAVRDIPLVPGASAFLTTTGQGPLTSGWVRVSNAVIGGTVIFSLFDTQDNLITEAGVAPATPSQSFTIPLDTTGIYNTGVALANASSEFVAGTIRLLNSTGGELGSLALPSLASMNQMARYVTELFPGVGAGLRGSLSITTSTRVAAVGLRQAASVLTALPTIEGVSPPGPRAPSIRSLSASSGAPGQPLTIFGDGYSVVASQNIVRFGTIAAPVSSATTTALTVTVPPGLTVGPYAVTVTVAGQVSNAQIFTVAPQSVAVMGSFKGTTNQTSSPIFFGTDTIQGTSYIYLTRTEYRAVCSRGSFIFSISGLVGEWGVLDRDGRFNYTNADGDVIQGQFDSPVRLSGSITYAPFTSTSTGSCPAVNVRYTADHRPSAPVITGLMAQGPLSNPVVRFTGTQPGGSQVTRFNLYFIDRNFRPILTLVDSQGSFDIEFLEPFASALFEGAIPVADISQYADRVVGVQLVLQNATGATIHEMSVPIDALFSAP